MEDEQPDPPDGELIARIRRRTEDRESAVDAFDALFERHSGYVYQCALNAKISLLGRAIDPDDFVQEVFSKVWLSASETFDVKRQRQGSSSSRATRAWLGRIASNLVKDRLKMMDCTVPVELNEGDKPLPSSVASNSTSYIFGVVNQTLSDRDAKIVWLKAKFYDPESGLSEPDSELVEKLCKECKLKPEALRKVYSRALKTLEAPLISVLSKKETRGTDAPAK